MPRPRVLFCTAAGGEYGFGHLKRCTSVIDEGDRIFEGVLLIRGGTEAGNLKVRDILSRYSVCDNLENAGDVDLIISDQRDTGRSEIKGYTKRAPVISLDDRGAGRRCAHVTIFSLPTVEGFTGNYAGPSYIVIDRTIREARKDRVQGSDVVVSFGGTDPHNLTEFVTRALNRIKVKPLVVRGPLFTHKPPAGEYTPVENPESMGEVLSRAAVLITSFGLTVYEALYLDIPVILYNHSRYHFELARSLTEPQNIGYHGALKEEVLSERLAQALSDRHRLIRSSAGNRVQIDDRGAERIVSIIEKALQGSRKGCLFDHGVYTALKRENTHTLMACSTCGDVFLYELEGPGDIYGDGDYFFSEYERQYGKSYVEDRENISRLGEARLDMIERCFTRRAVKGSGLSTRDHSAQSKKLLDVGCALGFFMDVSRQRGWMPTGVEISPFAARWVREHLGFSVVNASFLETEFQPESFDVITFFFVAEHFKDVEKVIERAYTALKWGGLITFALPNRGGISYRIDRARYVDEHPRDHYFDTSPRNLVRFLKQYGFRKLRVRTTGIHPERFFRKLGMGRNIRLLDAIYNGIARVMRLGDTFEYYGVKI